jgi:methionine synthase I (cobalamin-dependent)
MVSLTFDQRRGGFSTFLGDPLGPSLARLAAEGADVVGANCTVTSAAMGALAAEALAGVAAPLILQPNAGQPRATPAGVVYDQAPEVFAAQVAALAGGRVRAVGGCCGTDPRFIAALAERLARGTA